METSEGAGKKSLWLAIEEKIQQAGSQVLAGENAEETIQKIAGQLDSAGYGVSGSGDHMMDLRRAVAKAQSVGKPLLDEFNAAVSALTLEDVADPYAAASRLLDALGTNWPELRGAARRPDVVEIVEETQLNLLVAKAKGMAEDAGIRLLIGEKVEDEVIVASMEISEETLKGVHEAIAKEKAERARVEGLLEKVADKSKEEQVRHLFDNDVSEALIIEIGQVDQGVIDAAKQAMEEELKEKERLAAEEAERKKKEAEGPSLEDIEPDQMAYFIESIREIMEFSEEEKEIRVMCEQSAIPKALVEIAVSDPDKLDELEKAAEG